MTRTPDRSAWWVAFAGVMGAVVGAAITGGFNYLGHQGDLNAKMIELSIGILRAEPTPETTALREWALDVLDKRGPFSFSAVQRAVILKQPLPFATMRGLCSVFPRPEYVITGSTQYDQDWIDEMIETGVAACAWKRPSAHASN